MTVAAPPAGVLYSRMAPLGPVIYGSLRLVAHPAKQEVTRKMDLGLQGKKAIVTGGTRGIGRAIADLLAAEGCDVAICARNREAVKETAATLARAAGNACRLDVDGAD